MVRLRYRYAIWIAATALWWFASEIVKDAIFGKLNIWLESTSWYKQMLSFIITNPWLLPVVSMAGLAVYIAIKTRSDRVADTVNTRRNEARVALISTPGATPTSPKVASPELNFDHIDYKFIGDNPPLLLIHWDVMPTGNMHLEQAEIEILGRKIPFADWETCTISPSVTFMFTNHCEIKGKLPTGNHDIRILALANREWWASNWQTITYSPSVLDKEDSQT